MCVRLDSVWRISDATGIIRRLEPLEEEDNKKKQLIDFVVSQVIEWRLIGVLRPLWWPTPSSPLSRGGRSRLTRRCRISTLPATFSNTCTGEHSSRTLWLLPKTPMPMSFYASIILLPTNNLEETFLSFSPSAIYIKTHLTTTLQSYKETERNEQQQQRGCCYLRYVHRWWMATSFRSFFSVSFGRRCKNKYSKKKKRRYKWLSRKKLPGHLIVL